MTKAEVFIIESLKLDEEDDYCEGQMIYRSLRMSLKEPIYRYVRTRTELEHFIEEFEDSDYRYLHLSCHGSKSSISLTFDTLRFDEFSKIVGPALEKRRLFLSTCKATQLELAAKVFSESACYSVAGPTGRINFDDSVILWTSFYHFMFKHDSSRMTLDTLRRTLRLCGSLVDEEITLYTRSSKGSAVLQLPAAEHARR